MTYEKEFRFFKQFYNISIKMMNIPIKHKHPHKPHIRFSPSVSDLFARQWGHLSAVELISPPHSLHFMSTTQTPTI
jgi:hypothetical protein